MTKQIGDGEVVMDWFDDYEEDFESESIEYDITSVPNDFNIKTIFDLMDAGVIKMPSFQRNYVWDQYRASKLIESLVIGLPIPQVFLYEENRNNFLVIDGQQRLMSIYYFVKQRFPKKDRRGELRRIIDMSGRLDDATLSNDDYFGSFNLKLSENVSQRKNKLHRLNYSSLGDLKFSFDMRPLRVMVIRQNLPNGDDSSMYEIFNRLNSGGVNLRPQEIRASMYHSKFYDMLYGINVSNDWRNLINLPSPDIHMKDVEIILRSFAAIIDSGSYKSSLRGFINSFSRKAKSFDKDKVDFLDLIFSKFIKELRRIESSVFVNKRGKFNISLFESVAYAYLRKYVENMSIPESFNIDILKIEAVKNNVDFVEASLYASGTSSKYLKRLATADGIINADATSES